MSDISEARYDILEALQRGPARSSSVAERIARDPGSVNTRLHQMLACGLVRRVSHGCYAIDKLGIRVLASRERRLASIAAGTHKVCSGCNKTHPAAEFEGFARCWSCRQIRRNHVTRPKPVVRMDLPVFATGHLSPVIGWRVA